MRFFLFITFQILFLILLGTCIAWIIRIETGFDDFCENQYHQAQASETLFPNLIPDTCEVHTTLPLIK